MEMLGSESDIRRDERERIASAVAYLLSEHKDLTQKLIGMIRNLDPVVGIEDDGVLFGFPKGRNPHAGVPQDSTAPDWPYSKPEPGPECETCQSDSDGDCVWRFCPQRIDGEPMKSGRSCPLYDWNDLD